MAASNNAKPSPLLGFNWAESLKKAEQEGTIQKTEAAPSKSDASAKTNANTASPKQKQSAVKPQQRLRTKV